MSWGVAANAVPPNTSIATNITTTVRPSFFIKHSPSPSSDYRPMDSALFRTPRFPCTHLHLSVAVNRPLSNRLDALSPGGERGDIGMGGRLISEAALIGTPPMVW